MPPEPVPPASILWRRPDPPGHDFCRLYLREGLWYLEGTAVFLEHREPCQLAYEVICDDTWTTVAGRVEGWRGATRVRAYVTADDERRWRVNDQPCPEVDGCTDLDLSFSPASNLIALPRLNLAVGEEAAVRSAWLTFPEMTLEPLDQVYRRTGDAAYHYQSGDFVAELTVDDEGFVTDYAGLWTAETG